MPLVGRTRTTECPVCSNRIPQHCDYSTCHWFICSYCPLAWDLQYKLASSTTAVMHGPFNERPYGLPPPSPYRRNP